MSLTVSVISLSVILASACGAEPPLAPSPQPQPLQPTESATMSGWIYERADADHPCLAGALIVVKYGYGTQKTTLSDGEGYYEITVQPGPITISASKEGYEAKTWELTLLKDTVLNFALIPH